MLVFSIIFWRNFLQKIQERLWHFGQDNLSLLWMFRVHPDYLIHALHWKPTYLYVTGNTYNETYYAMNHDVRSLRRRMRILLRFQVKCKLTKAWEPKNSLSSLKCCVIIYPIVKLCNSVRTVRFPECDRSAFCRLCCAHRKKMM